MAENKHHQLLTFDTPDGLQDDIVNSLATLHATKNIDERGRQLWIYYETRQVREYTNIILLKMDPSINNAIGKRELAVCDILKGPRVVRTGDGPSDYQEARPGSIAIITPMTHEKVPIWLADIGQPFSESNFISAGKQDKVMMLPGTKFRLGVPYYLMVRPVRNI